MASGVPGPELGEGDYLDRKPGVHLFVLGVLMVAVVLLCVWMYADWEGFYDFWIDEDSSSRQRGRVRFLRYAAPAGFLGMAGTAVFYALPRWRAEQERRRKLERKLERRREIARKYWRERSRR